MVSTFDNIQFNYDCNLKRTYKKKLYIYSIYLFLQDFKMFGADLPYNMYIHDDEPKTDQGWNFDLEEYLTPHNQVPHPWSRSTTGDSHLEQDFILVAEFSELEGPREVVRILLSLHSLFWRNVASSF